MGLVAPSSRRNHRREQSGRKSPGDFALCISFCRGWSCTCPLLPCIWMECKKTLHLEEILVSFSGWPGPGLFSACQVCGSLGVQKGQSWSTASLPQQYLFLFRGNKYCWWRLMAVQYILLSHGQSSVVGQGHVLTSLLAFPEHSFPVLHATDWPSASRWLFPTRTFCFVNLVPHCKLELWEHLKLKVSCNFSVIETEGIWQMFSSIRPQACAG